MAAGRILRVSAWNSETIRREPYEKDPSLAGKPYAEQARVLFGGAFMYADAFSREMRALGWDAHEVVCNLPELQRAWAAENGVPFDPSLWKDQVLEAQIERLRPDVLYLQHGYRFSPALHGRLKQRFPFLKLVAAYKGLPGLASELADVDVLFVGIPGLLEPYQKIGREPHLLYHAFNQAVLEALGPAPKPDLAFTFSGASGYGHGLDHQARYWALVELMSRTPLEAWLDREPRAGASARLKLGVRRGLGRALRVLGPSALDKLSAAVRSREGALAHKAHHLLVEAMEGDRGPERSNREGREPDAPLTERFPDRCHPAVFGMDMYRLLRRSKVTFNKHTDLARGSVGNMRLFEATGVGACLLTDRGSNLADLFEADREVAVYSTPEEAAEKARWLLDHDKERRELAEAGRRRTLKDHTAKERCRVIDEVLRKRL